MVYLNLFVLLVRKHLIFVAQPPPKTMTPEYKEATKEYLKEIGAIPEGFYMEQSEEDAKRVKL